MKKHEKFYKNSPKLETDEAGKKYIKKGPTEAEKKSAEVNDGTVGTQKHEGMSVETRHAMERRDLHNRHETEHSMHKDDKKEMHGRHQKDIKEMHKRHEGEMKSGADVIKKVEKTEE